MERYIDLALSLGLSQARLITPGNICFDVRAWLKCRWGCDWAGGDNMRCDERGTTLDERMDMIRRYERILVVRGREAGQVSRAVLEIERAAFLDGRYFAFGLRACNLCPSCQVLQGRACLFPNKVRPCDQLFGIDVYRTVRGLGMPCEVLHDPNETQNRYGFVLIE
ncbi:MAG: DUF2284 domain-containing protein [Proteobacteria bacterium]|nr:DUF2284 domain-containing protein [Pseudomonadota bacterium]